MKTKTRNSDDQHWDVFRYVAEEMTIEEERRFESKLMHDQELREQVGKMTMTLADIEQVFSKPIKGLKPRSTANTFRVRRFAVSAAALVAISALAISFAWQPADPEPTTESVALAWAENFELEELDFPAVEEGAELTQLEFESDDDGDWIAGVVAAVNEGTESLN